MTAFAPNLKFIDTHSNPDTQCDKLAPDVGVYPIDDQPQGDAKTDFSKMDFLLNSRSQIHPTHSLTQRILCNHKQGDFRFEKDSDDARLVRGQLASYAAAHEGCQFRVHIFCVLVCGKYARFIRWDRDGATVTQRFDYIKQPQLLAGFFWRYEHLDHHQQGYDTSVFISDTRRYPTNQHFESRFRDDNPSHREFLQLWFRTVKIQKSKSDLSYHFLQSTPLAHRSDEPLDPCWLSTWKRERSSF
jgi:hypothetical protein